MAWDNIISDPEFQKQPAQVRARVAVNYFKEHISSDPEFAKQPVEVQGKVKTNFFSSLDVESPFEARRPNLYAIGKTFENVPRVLASGATFGLTERVREGSRQLAEMVTGKSLPETDPYAQIPSLSRSVGEFVGAAVPIGTDFSVAKPAVTKAAQYLLKGARAAEPLAAVATGAGLGAGYTVAERGIKEGSLPTASEIGMSAASWAGMEALGLGVQYSAAIRSLAKELGVAPKVAQQIAVKEARSAGMPDLEYTVNKTQIQKALRIMESEKAAPLAPDAPAKVWAENTIDNANQTASAWVSKVEELAARPKQQGKLGTYQDLVKEKSFESTKSGLKQATEDARIGMFGKPYEASPEIKPIEVSPNAYIDPEGLARGALSAEIQRITDTPSFLRTPEERIALDKFMQEGQATNIPGKELPVIGDMQETGLIQPGMAYRVRDKVPIGEPPPTLTENPVVETLPGGKAETPPEILKETPDLAKLTSESDDVRIVDGEVFQKLKSAQTARHGYAWFNNGKPRFGEGYKSIQLTDRLPDLAKQGSQDLAKQGGGGQTTSSVAPDIEFALYEMRSQLQSGEKGGLKGQLDEGTGDYIYLGSGYPEWFTDMVKRFNDPKRSPLSGKVGISSKEVISIINKKLNGKPLTWKQGVLYNDIERSAAGENFNLAGQEPPKGLGEWEPAKTQPKNVEIPGTERGVKVVDFHINPVVPMAKAAFKKIKGFFDDMEIKTLGKSPDETIGHAVRRVSQDKFIALRDWEDTLQKKYGITLTKRDSAYHAEERSHGIVADKLQTFDRDVVKPFIDSVVSVQKKYGLTLNDLDRYLKAKDAPNRNRVIQERNSERLANAKTPEEVAAIQNLGSGLSDAEAASILQKYGGKEAILDDLAKVVYWANKKKLDMIERYGLESPEIVQQMRQTFGDTYVPWKGKEGLRSGSTGGKGTAIGAKNSGLKQALGRTSEAENSIIHSFEDLKDTISRIHKNEVGKSFLNLVEKYPDTSIEINKVKLDQRLNPSTGQVETFNRPVWANGEPLDPFAENVISVLRDGQHYYIRINDNPLLARALTASYDKPSALGHVVGAIGAVTRNIASIYTRFSPSFAVTNPVRDFFDAMQGVATEYKISMAARAAKLIPESTKDIYKYNTTGKGMVYTQEFAQNGGMVGFYSGKDYKETAKFFEKEIRRGTGNSAAGATYRTLSKVGTLLSDVTSSTENATRLATYRTLRENGYSIEDAVSYAKNITINFNRHGEWKWLNQLYMFSNPAIQGIQRFGKLASTTKGQTILGGITGLAVALNEYNRYVAGEDEGGINNYDKISNTEKSRNIIIIDPSDGKPLVKIPLGFFQRLPFALATALSDSAHQTKGNAKIAMDVMDAMLDAFNPVGGSQLATTLVPTPAKPVMELYANKNWLGNPIKPEQMPWDVRPESQMYFSGASMPSKFAAEKLNAATGGDEFTPGMVDISPESIDHVAQFFTGTLGKDIYKVMDLGARYFDGMRPLSDLKAGDIPIVGRFTGANTEFYTFSKFKEVSEEALRAYKKADSWTNSDDPRLDAFLDKSEGIVVLGQEVGKIQKEISSLNGDIRKVKEMKDLDDIDKREIIKELNQEKEKQMNIFIRAYNEAK